MSTNPNGEAIAALMQRFGLQPQPKKVVWETVKVRTIMSVDEAEEKGIIRRECGVIHIDVERYYARAKETGNGNG